MIAVIAARELRSALVTPLPWVLLGGGQVVLAWIFLQVVDDFAGTEERVASLTTELTLNLFSFAAVILMLAAPVLAMRMLSGEFRDGTFDLVATAPVRIGELVLGKFLALAFLLTPFCLLPGVAVSLLAGSAELDVGQLAAATLGLWLVGLMFCAVALYGASLSEQPGAAVLTAYAILLLLSIIGRADAMSGQALTLFGWLAWNEHLLWFLLGAVRLSDLAYLGSFMLFFLALTQRRLANRVWR
ncbi:MAG: ABC transporter permease [Sphingobacteriia bacterium]|nr:ABC transporter permease [Sphingobacteriia bacterium]NCC38593.1 ABC transporter permease [Gammaproteobacteria bacterium]